MENRIQPYKIANLRGIFHLASDETGTAKLFRLAKIRGTQEDGDVFSLNPEVIAMIEQPHGFFLGLRHEVVLRVANVIVDYFTY